MRVPASCKERRSKLSLYTRLVVRKEWVDFRLEDHALAVASIHDYHQRRFKVKMAHTAVFFDSRLRAEPLPIHKTFARVGIDGEIADLECGEILEEVSALRGCYAEVAEAGLNDDTGSENLVPFDWNS